MRTRTVCCGMVAALLLGLSAVPVPGDAREEKSNPCAGAAIGGEQAKEIAAAYLDELGYQRLDLDSDWHFRLGDAACVNGQWRVKVELGPSAEIRKKRMVLVNCQTGEIEDQFAEGPDLAVK